MKIKILRLLANLFKFITGSNFVDIAAHNAIKERLQKLERSLDGQDKYNRIYVDKHNADELTAWRELAKWSDNDNARKWAFERINALLIRMAHVTPQNSQDFWVIQGALAEMNNFLQIEDRILSKVREIEGEGEQSETDSLSDRHS